MAPKSKKKTPAMPKKKAEPVVLSGAAYCEYCGHELPKGSMFCENCGKEPKST